CGGSCSTWRSLLRRWLSWPCSCCGCGDGSRPCPRSSPPPVTGSRRRPTPSRPHSPPALPVQRRSRSVASRPP
ncbi:MAG: hypothetical protein AVDCRST_MAG16-2996, partial [uncultured Frankineae bacterium]